MTLWRLIPDKVKVKGGKRVRLRRGGPEEAEKTIFSNFW